MATSTSNPITAVQAAQFFLGPETPLQRQYEALRAYFVEGVSTAEVADRFGYSPGSFRVLCHQFRHDRAKRAGFFQIPQRGPRGSPARDRARELVVAMRKRNLSVYDIQDELAAAGHTLSINTLSLLLREEGFARLPRRRDDERPPTTKPEPAAVADVRTLSLAPRSFRTRLGGLFLFVPLMRALDLAAVLRQASLPGSDMVPAAQAVRTLLALKLIGKERKSHVMDLVSDEGIALFAGLNVVPKRSYLAAYSSQIDDRTINRLMAAWFAAVPAAGLTRGTSLDLDFHTVPANSQEEPLEKHYISRRSRSQKGILTFLARDATQRVLCYARAGIAKAEQAEEISRFVDFWQQHTGSVPTELVFDSRLTTYSQLDRLNQRHIHFLTLRRRTRKMLGAIWSRPASAWQRITLPALTRAFRTPKVLDERVGLPGYRGQLRQVTVIDLGHEEPTVLLTNNFKSGCPALVTRYAQRMLIENGIAEAIQFFHLDALSSMVGLRVDFDLQITLMASSLYRLLADKLGGSYRQAQAKTLFHHLLDVSAAVAIGPAEVVVTLDKRAHNPSLRASKLTDEPTPMPWFGGKPLLIRFA
jgi:transposase-like protein